MANQFTQTNSLRSFIGGSGQTMPARDTGTADGYVDSLNKNFTSIANVVNAIDTRLASVEQGSGLAAQGDAAANIPNLLINGSFTTTNIGIDNTYGWPWNIDIITNPNNNNAMMTRCPAWWLAGESSEPATNLGAKVVSRSGSLPYQYAVENGLVLWNNPDGGSVFQRLDFFYPIRWFAGRTIQFVVDFYSPVAGTPPIYLEISDGVNTINNSAGTILSADDNQRSAVSLVVDTAATKLSVRIVMRDLSISEADPVKVNFAYARLGSGSFIIPTQALCLSNPLDEVASAMVFREFNRDFFLAGMEDPTGSVASPATGGTVAEVARIWDKFDVPMFYEQETDVVLQQHVALGPNALPNDISLLSTEPLVEHIVQQWIGNIATDGLSAKKKIVDQSTTFYRLVGDASVGAYKGFSGRFQHKLAVIPTA